MNQRIAQDIFALLDLSHKECVYTPPQIARNLNKPIYKSCPWFLEYKEGRYLPKEELQHNAAVKERAEQAQKHLQNTITQSQEPASPSSSQTAAQEESNKNNPPQKMESTKETKSKKRSKY